MAKARAIVKRRKAVRNTRKITKTMQMIGTAKFQKSLKRTVGAKPLTIKVREVVADLVEAVGTEYRHELMGGPDRAKSGTTVVLVLTGNRGLAGGYNGSILRTAERFIRDLEGAGQAIELWTSGKKGYAYFTFQKRVVTQRHDQLIETNSFPEIRAVADQLMARYRNGEIDGVYVVSMNFVSTGVQRPDIMRLLPLSSVTEAAEMAVLNAREGEAAQKTAGEKGASVAALAKEEAKLSARGELHRTLPEEQLHDEQLMYEFMPSAKELLDELLPLTVRTTLMQCYLDATTSENVARMVSMKSATDNADKIIKALTMQYNRARQSQITTELSEIMGGVEAMKG
jgi:F-type H+-transporting ATPase subunit gamma